LADASHIAAFTESGTYAPTYAIGTWQAEDGQTNLFFLDGYAASAEAIQAASLAPLLNLSALLSIFTSTFDLPYNKEQHIMALDPTSPDFRTQLESYMGKTVDNTTLQHYRKMIREGFEAGVPLHKQSLNADDFFPEKSWEVLAISGYMRPDPYSGAPGVEEIRPGLYRVTVRTGGSQGDKRITFTMRLMESFEQSRLVFNPLLNRFIAGEDFQHRPVKISDSGRIRNELQTLCSEALDFLGDERIRIHFDRIPAEVIPSDKQLKLLEILRWYKANHPLWFSWLEISEA